MEEPGAGPEAVMRTGMLVRRPAAEVYEAFVDPAVTSRFWFSGGSGRLEVGKEVRWEWETYGVSVPVTATALEPGRRIVIEWPGADGPREVEWTFTPRGDDATFVRVEERGFSGDAAARLAQVADSTEGFTLALAGLKAWLEHGVRLGLVADRDPRGMGA